MNRGKMEAMVCDFGDQVKKGTSPLLSEMTRSGSSQLPCREDSLVAHRGAHVIRAHEGTIDSGLCQAW